MVKRRCVGTHVVPQAGAAAATDDIPAVGAKPKAFRVRPKNSAPKRTKVEATMSRGSLPPFPSPPTPPPPPEAIANVAQDVLDDGSIRYTLTTLPRFFIVSRD
jgi:hypothetical protein